MSEKKFNEVAEVFAEAMAALIEHPECPERVYENLTDFVSELAADLAPACTVEDEARAIRKTLSSLLNMASRAETLEVSND